MAVSVFRIQRYFVLAIACVGLAVALVQIGMVGGLLPAAAGYEPVPGAIVSLASRIDTIIGAQGYPTQFRVYEVQFQYSAQGGTRVSNKLSPLCSWCKEEDLARVLGKNPSEINTGQIVKVFVTRSDPSQAFLEPPTMAMLYWFVLKALTLLVLVPVGAYIICRFLKGQEMAERDVGNE